MASRESFKKYVGEKNGTYTNSRDTFKDYVNSGDAEKSRKRREEYKQQEQQKRQQTAGTTASEKSTSNTVEINGQQYKKVDIDFDAINHDVLYRNDRSDYDSTNYNSVVAKPPEKVEHPTKWTYKDNLEYIPEWQEYHMSLSDEEKNELEKEKIASEAYRYAEEHPVLATMAQVGLAPSVMLESSAGMLYELTKKNVADTYNRDPIWNKVFEATNKAYLNMGIETGLDSFATIGRTGEEVRHSLADYEGIDVNNPLFDASDIKSAMQQGVTDKYDLNALGKDWFDLAYGSGMSMVDSMVAQVVNKLVPGGGTALLGMSAATQTLRDSKNKGLTDEQALNNAIVAGAAEMVFESISLGNFKALQEVSPTGIKDIVVNVLKSAGVNASEELLTEVTNIVYDLVANGDKSDYNLAVQQYIKSDVSPEDAKKLARKDIINQIVDATIGGFISGVGFGGVGSVGGYISNSPTQKSVGSQVKADDDVTAYVDVGLQAKKGSDANKYAKAIDKAIEKGKTPKDSEIGRLAIAVEQYINEHQHVNDIKSKGEFAGIENADELEQAYANSRNNMGVGTSKDIRATKRDYKPQTHKQPRRFYIHFFCKTEANK